MERLVQAKLNLNPRSHEELREMLDSFELKWRHKARRELSS